MGAGGLLEEAARRGLVTGLVGQSAGRSSSWIQLVRVVGVVVVRFRGCSRWKSSRSPVLMPRTASAIMGGIPAAR